jgi:hypothetical protein
VSRRRRSFLRENEVAARYREAAPPSCTMLDKRSRQPDRAAAGSSRDAAEPTAGWASVVSTDASVSGAEEGSAVAVEASDSEPAAAQQDDASAGGALGSDIRRVSAHAAVDIVKIAKPTKAKRRVEQAAIGHAF